MIAQMTGTYPGHQILQNCDLNLCLTMEALLVPDNFDGDVLPSFVIPTLQNLSERSLSKHPFDLIPICKVVTRDDEVVAPLVVVAMIVSSDFWCGRILGVPCTGVEDLLEVDNFAAFVPREIFEVRFDESWVERPRVSVSTRTGLGRQLTMRSHLWKRLSRIREAEQVIDLVRWSVLDRSLGLLPLVKRCHLLVRRQSVIVVLPSRGLRARRDALPDGIGAGRREHWLRA